MDRQRLRLVAVVASGILVFGSAALVGAGPFTGRPVTLRSGAPWASDVALVGDRAAWLELVKVSEDQRLYEPVLVVRRVADAEASRLPVPAAAAWEGWLDAGPAMTGDCTPRPGCWAVALVGRSFPSAQLFVYRAPEGRWQSYSAPSRRGEDPVLWRDLTAAGDLVAFAVVGSGAVMGLDLTTGLMTPLVAGAPGIETHPAVSREWLVWVEEGRASPAAGGHDAGAGVSGFQAADGRLMARRLPDGPDVEVARGATGRPAVAGGRVLWRRLDPAGGPSAVWVTDLETRQSGRLASDSLPLPGAELYADITPQLIVRSGGRGGRVLVAHDARAITSFANLETYLTGFAVADVLTAAVAPAASGSRIAWSEPEPGAAAEIKRVRYLSLVRLPVYLPWASAGPAD